MLDLPDLLRILHPAFAIAIVFPSIGTTLYMAWQTRQRRLRAKAGELSQIPLTVGMEHVKVGRWLAGAVVGLCLLGLARPTFSFLSKNGLWTRDPFQSYTLVLLFALTIASLVFLYRARQRLWLGVFATLTGMGVVLLGIQDILFNRPGFGAIFRRDSEWFVSHFYFGIAATMLMIFSLAIVQDIYQDRTQRWRYVHVILNSIATLLFVAQGITGARDLLEIPLGWQEPYIYQCDYTNKVCPTPQGNAAAARVTLARGEVK